ncbi:hypothetical protein KAFR_0B06760 [Kazachstania africana CBS 2517]|uniref:Glycerol uptake protein 1 n=1 Tax=Kazachstania africana (strain ATCC 22294 / BCRC 22015 / CBS 2517 / CECT 1963 / NBRC 1671 / NRRL Y-8276) TaxID=1071382 RepID=H2ARH3_KAZAF|nr:hypothetical protein KAFR_0B06760 [Kazachstania africana CBS 2517]CCF56973.1 hypothetical protein KAFR_0B06760 [Kazachstania africana CBS 2517]
MLSDAIRKVRYFFSAEALDARISPDPELKKRYKLLANGNNSNGVSRPLWNTLEFKFYYLAFITVIPMMFITAMSASNETNEANYYKFERLLSQGWLFGRKVDNSDAQYRFFRDNFFLLLQLMSAHLIIKKVTLSVNKTLSKLRFDFIFGLIFLFAAHGVNAVRIIIHILIMHSISHFFKKNKTVAASLTWLYGISTLFINDKYREYPFGNILSILSPLDHSFKGIIERWDVFFNFTLLRLLSYNLDYLERWNSQFMKDTPVETQIDSDIGLKNSRPEFKRTSSTLKTIQESGKEELLNDRARLVAPLHIQEYDIFNFIAYVTYTPLFIAGPIITFNDYIYQSYHTLPSINSKRIQIYAIRFILTVLSMEFMLHYTYVVAVSKTKAWQGDTPFQISMIGLFNLNIIWLKLLIPWRLFRLWGLLDGIDTPENMIRLVDNNYSAMAFWRGWHRSYNKWIVRYIYIPLGGSNNRIMTSLAVFSFVAIWHDIQLKLLFWGWLIVLFLLPEIFLTQYFMQYKTKWWYRHICALGGAANIWMMMIANLFGFCLGSDGTMELLRDMFSTVAGFAFFIIATGCIFIGVQVMFELREEEKRNGINLKC